MKALMIGRKGTAFIIEVPQDCQQWSTPIPPDWRDWRGVGATRTFLRRDTMTFYEGYQAGFFEELA